MFNTNHYKVKHIILKTLSNHSDKIPKMQELRKHCLGIDDLVYKTKNKKDDILSQLDCLVLADEVGKEEYGKETLFRITQKGGIAFSTNKYLIESKKENLDIYLKRTQIITLLAGIIITSLTMWNNLVRIRSIESKLETQNIKLLNVEKLQSTLKDSITEFRKSISQDFYKKRQKNNPIK